MKRDFLKAMGLTDEQIDSIMSEHGSTVNAIKTERDNLEADRDKLKDEVKNRDNQIKALDKNIGDFDKLKSELDNVKQENQNWETKYQSGLLDSNIKLAVAKDAKDANDILLFINKSGLKLNEQGQVEGLEQEVTRLKTEKPYLFGEPATPPANTQTPPATPPNTNVYTPPSGITNTPKDVDPVELGKQDAARFAKKE